MAATQYTRDRFPSRLMSESRFEDPVVRGYLKCSSVSDFMRRSFALQLRRVKWTSPRHCTHRLYSLHLAVTRSREDQEKYPVKKSPEARGKNSDGAGATPPFDAPCITGAVGSLPPQSRVLRDLL
jgi:hypothetical protein